MAIPLERRRSQFGSLIAYGLSEQNPNHYLDMLRVPLESRGNLRYAWRTWRNGCFDGCALGTTAPRDWLMNGIYLCNGWLQLFRLSTRPAMDHRGVRA
jgi:hypothetical protein